MLSFRGFYAQPRNRTCFTCGNLALEANWFVDTRTISSKEGGISQLKGRGKGQWLAVLAQDLRTISPALVAVVQYYGVLRKKARNALQTGKLLQEDDLPFQVGLDAQAK